MEITFETGTCRNAPIEKNSSVAFDKQYSCFETSWVLNKEVGMGSFKEIELRPGFDLYIADYKVKKTFTTCLECHRPAFGFGFWMSGIAIGTAVGMPPKYIDSKGGAPIYYYPDRSGRVEDIKNSYRRSITLIVEPDLLHALLGGTIEHLPKDFKTFLEGDIQGQYPGEDMVTARISQVLDQLFHCSLTGATRRLFLESKAMELIALRLDQLPASTCNRGHSHALGPGDIKRIHFAASRLCKDLENPPSLSELAASTGISHAKLNRGFRQVYGTTVFGYLRQFRLQKAKTLLEERRLNVTESAFTVGYNSLSSFTRAFRAQFGCNPQAYLSKQRRYKM